MPLLAPEVPVTRLLWLPDVLRAAGLTVREVNGWQTRGSSTYDPQGIICHATAGATGSSDSGEIGVLLNGSNTAPPPIAQLYLSRTGVFHVVASGKCFHALTGWGGPLKGHGNTHLIGIEAANDNRGEPWPDVQVDAYQRGVAAICKHKGWTADRNVAAHREHQPYPPPSWTTSSKSDPHGIDMTRFRARVTALIAGEDDDMPTIAEVQEAVVQGVYVALAQAASPAEGDAGKRARQTRDAIRKIMQPVADQEGTSADELAAALAGLPQMDPQALAAQIAAAMPADQAKQVADELAARLAG